MLGAAPPPPGLIPRDAPSPIITMSVPADLAGKSVCFTGPSRFTFRGGQVSRPMQELLAVEHGLTVLPRVTKKLDILVVCHPEVGTGKTTKAASYGTTVVDEAAFWTALGEISTRPRDR